MSEWSNTPSAGRRPGSAAGVRFDDPWAAAEQARSGRRRLLDFVSRPTRNLLIAALAPVVVLALVWSGTGSSSKDVVTVAGVASPAPAPVAAPSDPGRRTYAVAVPSLRGLPEGAAPGTRLDLWVAWEDRVKTKTRLQHLLDDVRLERIVPPATPDSAPAALLSVPEDSVPDLLYGDLFGSFAVTIRR